MYLEYNWTAYVYQPRFGDRFIDVRGWRSFADMREAVSVLNECGLTVGRKTASRTWEIIPVPDADGIATYGQHDDTVSDAEKRFTSAQFGSGEAMKAQAWSLLMPRIRDKVLVA